MKFDIFYQLPEAANQVTTERYRELIAEAAEADRLGFNTVWLAEVHFAPRFSVMPTPLLLLAAIAERTTNLRLGMAVNLMPLHHPIRLAEEIATLDVLSGGRVEFGAGRGAFPLNYRGYGVEMADSRALFQDGLETIKAAWTGKLRRWNQSGSQADPAALSADSPRRQQRRHFHLRRCESLSDLRRRSGESDPGAGRAAQDL